MGRECALERLKVWVGRSRVCWDYRAVESRRSKVDYLARLCFRGEPKINKHRVFVDVQEHVLWLDIPVAEATLMHVANRLQTFFQTNSFSNERLGVRVVGRVMNGAALMHVANDTHLQDSGENPLDLRHSQRKVGRDIFEPGGDRRIIS